MPLKKKTYDLLAKPEIEATAARSEAKRDPILERYDVLDPEFLRCMALIGGYGAQKYGAFNYQQSRLTGDKSPINHIYKHLRSYQKNEKYDHPEIGQPPFIHLAAIAFNAMMEFYHEVKAWEAEDDILSDNSER